MRPHKFTSTICSILIGLSVLGTVEFATFAQEPKRPKHVRFSRDIAPLLVSQCLSCHDNSTREGGYSVRTARDLSTSGDSGLPPIIAGEASSEMLVRIFTPDEDRRMPSDAEALPELSAQLFAQWIQEGASIDIDETIPLEELTLGTADQFERPDRYMQTVPISAICLCAAQQIAVSGYGEVLFWDLERKTITSRLKVSGRRIADIDASRDGRFLAVSSGVPGEYGAIEIFEKISDSSWAQVLVRSLRDVSLDVEFSPDGKRTLIGQSNGSVRVIDNHLLREVFVLDSHAATVTSVCWSDDGKKFFSASRDRSAKSYQSEKGQIIASYPDHDRVVGGVAASERGVYTLDETGALRSWTEGINPNSIARTEGISARTNKVMQLNPSTVAVVDANKLKVIQQVSEEVEDGKDDKGEPKKRKQHRFEQTAKSQDLDSTILCADATWLSDQSRGLIVAGLQNGSIWIWDTSANAAYDSGFKLP